MVAANHCFLGHIIEWLYALFIIGKGVTGMDARNRMADVVKLRCNACQDFLKLIISDNWQQFVYNKAQREIQDNGRYKEEYLSAYEKMREIGIDNYSVNDMDVTFISEIIHGCRNIAPTAEGTRKRLEQLIEDRNFKGHSSENDEDEELYLQGLLALCNLRSFVKTVDKFETNIADEKRIEFIRKYLPVISEKMDLLDNERISLIQRKKDIEKDVKRIIDCTDEKQRHHLWSEIKHFYIQRYWLHEKDYDRCFEFEICASDAGIKEAHSDAVDYYIKIRDFNEAERRLQLYYDSYEIMPAENIKWLIYTINKWFDEVGDYPVLTDRFLSRLEEQGKVIVKNEDGSFEWIKNP